MRTALAVVLWASLALIVYAHVGYPLLLAALARVRRTPEPQSSTQLLPRVSLIVAAHDEEAVIERRVENAIALDYPPERLEVIVASERFVRRMPPWTRPWVTCSRSRTQTRCGSRTPCVTS
jgi:cellulose synthase/poly-beta-1,6-N-acetylglucosamine synthase-like glycosyltransferase